MQVPTMKPLDSDKKAAKEAEAPAKAAEAAPAQDDGHRLRGYADLRRA